MTNSTENDACEGTALTRIDVNFDLPKIFDALISPMFSYLTSAAPLSRFRSREKHLLFQIGAGYFQGPQQHH
jgi:hypothetical protein